MLPFLYTCTFVESLLIMLGQESKEHVTYLLEANLVGE
jgi:hypothetical protein